MMDLQKLKSLNIGCLKKNAITFQFCNGKGDYKFMALTQNAITYRCLLRVAVTVTTNGAIQVTKSFDAAVAKRLMDLH